MIRIRVDDFPQTKGEPQHSLAAFREFNRELNALTKSRYLLGVIPERCTPQDILMLRNETDCVIGMHGISHDESKLNLYGNEFPPYWSNLDVRLMLARHHDVLEQAVGRPVRIYMPPRNLIDMRTASVMNGIFDWYTAGPETDHRVMDRFGNHLFSEFPMEYGRTDELLAISAHEELMRRVDAGRHPILTLHWTWETNIGLKHMREFLGRIPHRYFTDFEWYDSGMERPDRSPSGR